MTVHYELPTTADFGHWRVSTIRDHDLRVDVARRERARTRGGRREERLRRGDRAVCAPGCRAAEFDALGRTRRDHRRPGALGGTRPLHRDLRRARLQRGIRAAQPARRRRARRLALHLGQLLRAPSQDQEAYAVPSRPTSGRSGTPRRPIARRQMPFDPNLPKNAEEAANREPGDAGTRRSAGTATAARARRTAVPRPSTSTPSAWPTRCARNCRCSTPTSASRSSCSPPSPRSASSWSARGTAGASSPCRAPPTASAVRGRRGAAAPTRRAQRRRGRSPHCTGLAEGSAGRVERDLAAIGRLAADGAVETLWFDFTTSVNGTLDPESGAIEFATEQRQGRGAARRHARRRPAAATRDARDREGRQGRHGAQRRPRRDGVVGPGMAPSCGSRWPDGRERGGGCSEAPAVAATERPALAADRRARITSVARRGHDVNPLAPGEADLPPRRRGTRCRRQPNDLDRLEDDATAARHSSAPRLAGAEPR